ncbi:cytochrome P450 [Streptomyces rhizosphaericus]|uniref:Cytochrome P450 n=1 Tax=Streptomyces rhizosphaericus TaxID=114699 RepID=A0A6G4AF43_9ACTN|nr:cytochrome P450 [Streptomyces rhizosphaericus]NEW71107.1 cytochrome P450 [Streptomyces rhizosphaericus]
MRLTAATECSDPSTIDALDPSWYATGDPHSFWRHLRAERPVYWHETSDNPGFWILTRHSDVCDVLRRFKDFTSEPGNLLTTLGKKDLASGKMLAVTDPPRHTAIKRQINSCFTKTAVEALEPEVRRLARRMFVPAVQGEVFDFALQSAFFPIAVTALLMGIDQRDWYRLKQFAYVAIADQDPDMTSGNRSRALEWSHSEIFSYFSVELAKDNSRRRDLIGAIAAARIDDRPLSREERLFNAYSVLLGATVTTSHSANVALLALSENPNVFSDWKAATADESFIEEVFRWSSPANHFVRYATRDVVIRDTLIREGDPVTVWLGSANRDEEIFDAPYLFDIHRDPRLHIAFGVGAHRCIGAPLARLAIRIFSEEARRLISSLEVSHGVEHLSSNFIAGIKRLPIQIELTNDARRELSSLEPFVDEAM